MLNHPNKNKSTTKKRYSIQVLSNQQNLDCCINLSSFYAYSDLTPESIEVAHDTITIYLKSNLSQGVCPYCGEVSSKVHSRYVRSPSDLSILGKSVVLRLYARKFFCHNPMCGNKTFAEQPGNEIFRYRRRTRRCEL